ncbi:hypothetical protein [Actinokineospora sp. UTMC 2448]|uniref:hypothetical protein n=1 Tax=Actinokineospora sp. UTMC 2448 TaxID=2268449 RepID=UPI0021647578|nr:hypothetical protein [Actinokineospora sp. UTMC 2448]
MTIYSQHPNRGKIQILATYRGPNGVDSTTVTSVDNAALAAPIVEALNQISACATVPVSVHDTRDNRIRNYPSEHLNALTDRGARADLLVGAHSLWYEHVKVLLHEGLTDLDAALAEVPGPVRIAVTAELEAEARGLREALAEYSEGVEPPEAVNRRCWDFGAPFVAFGGGVDGLGTEDRGFLDRAEEGLTAQELGNAAADLRLLLDAYAQCGNSHALLMVSDFAISDDPADDERDNLFVDVLAPLLAHDRQEWQIDLCRWVPDDPDEEYGGATGEPVLRCARSTPPTAAEIAELLNRSGGDPEQLAAWAKTAVGEPLDGTVFVVTERYDRQVGNPTRRLGTD